MALIALVAIACIMGLTEASGVTSVVPTVIRIVRGEGAVVVEVKDPRVKVTVEGDGGLVITGAGLEEIRLRPGSYRVHADKDGKRVPLEREEVTIAKGGVEVVKVKLEAPKTGLTPIADGFRPLFDGQSLTGWAAAGGGTGLWKVEDGALTCSGPMAHLLTVRNDFADFHLRAEVKINAGGNSGVYFRAGKPLTVIGDYEAQITDNPGQGHRTGSLYGLVRVTESPVPPDTWFTLEIIALGKQIRVLVNGQQTADYTESRPGRTTQGHVALQHYDPKTRVYFRKVEVKKLPSAGSPSATPALKQPVGDLKLLANLDGHSDVVRAVAFSPDSQRIVSVGRDQKVQVWDLETRNLLSTLPVEGHLSDADVSLDGRFVAVVSKVSEKKVVAQVWDLEKRERMCTLTQEAKYAHCIRFSPDAARVVTCNNPSSGVLWDVATGTVLHRLDIGDTPITAAAALSLNGELVALGAVGRVRLFDAGTGQVLNDIHLPENRHVNDLVFNSTGETLACGQASGSVHLIDVDTREVTKSIKVSDAPVVRMRLLGNEQFLLATCFDATLRLVDIERGQVVATAATEKGTNERLAISPDGRYAVTASGEYYDRESNSHNRNGDYALRLWQLPASVWPTGPPPLSSSDETVDEPVTPKDP